MLLEHQKQQNESAQYVQGALRGLHENFKPYTPLQSGPKTGTCYSRKSLIKFELACLDKLCPETKSLIPSLEERFEDDIQTKGIFQY
ncbi:DNA-directed RNA polymerase II subunit RPB4-like [Choloepus didactylus]|uniref:DNA-directed RNA polymerase II subunit RPB4-like n=1 Tax=Choloepus didactylus TaxID=27675 RepID=UPI0018A00CE5|nr:DNA-directed RNA polymerase II subunit RPB4-like [Choloepus didactylus]